MSGGRGDLNSSSWCDVGAGAFKGVRMRDTPLFACAKAPIDPTLAQLANMD